MTIMKKLLLSLAVLVLGVLGVAFSRPSTFRVERTAIIPAAPEKVFPLVDDFHQWGTWSPWEKLDPGMKRTHSGAASGKGAVYSWEGNDQVGAGRMEILEDAAPSRVKIQLDFLRPFEGHNTAEFTLAPEGPGTRVTWAMSGRNTLLGKVIGLFMSMDRMIGKDFEAGLGNMKVAATR